MKANKPFVVILCGGRSLRLWPLSRRKSKNFLNLFGFSPLELTIKRFRKITSKERIILVASDKEKKPLGGLKSIKKNNILFEPESKNTAAAVLLALKHLQKHKTAPIIISPVDHLIKKEGSFYKALAKSLIAAKEGFIVTLGIKPKNPTSAFGYIQAKGAGLRGLYSVKRFIEKPKPALATKLIKEGKSFYNSGIFISRIDTLLVEYKKYYRNMNLFFGKGGISGIYKRIKSIPFDKAIMEKSKKVKMAKADFFWKDFGSWPAVYELLKKDKSNNAGVGKTFFSASANNMVYLDSPKKKVLVVGLKNIFFIDSKERALLIEASYLKKLKQILRKTI